MNYSICTLVTRPEQYQEMCESFVAHGFTPDDTEFLSVDNSEGNTVDAFAAYNMFLSEARSPYIILCHQDVCLLQDGRARLDEIIRELNELDAHWGLFGNAGKRLDGVQAVRISDPFGEDQARGGPLPAEVVSLDENFIVTRRSANLAVSHDLSGFHMYGTDLCLIARVLGLNAYVVDFHLRHKSAGTFDQGLQQSKVSFVRKYSRAFRDRWLYLPTPGDVFLTTSRLRVTFALTLRKLRSLMRTQGAS